MYSNKNFGAALEEVINKEKLKVAERKKTFTEK